MNLSAIFRPGCWVLGHRWRVTILGGEATPSSPAMAWATCTVCLDYVCCSTADGGDTWSHAKWRRREIDARLVRKLRAELAYWSIVWNSTQ